MRRERSQKLLYRDLRAHMAEHADLGTASALPQELPYTIAQLLDKKLAALKHLRSTLDD